MKINTRLLLGLFIFLFSLCCKAENLLFTAINTSDGLSDNQVRYILQLPDGRMVFTTSGSLNLFDGQQFNYLHRSPQHIAELNQYDGHYRIYQEDDSQLWIKEMRKMMCIDLRKEQYKEEVADYLKQRTAVDGIGDLFVDGQSRIWLLSGDSLILNRREKIFDLTSEQGILQDLTADDSHLYLFYHTGKVVCYDLESGARQYDSYAFDTTETELFDKTSLVVSGMRGYYQLRNGRKGGFFFFDKERKAWERLLETDYVLNTLIVTPDEKAYISCANGIWTFDCESKALHYYPELRSVDGMVFDTEVSTIFQDAQKGLWLGTLNQGLLYYHPQRYKFAYIGRSYFPFTHKDLMVYRSEERRVGKEC